MASLPGMFEHTITCNSLSKTFSITGWRLGYVVGTEEVIEACKKFMTWIRCSFLARSSCYRLELDSYRELLNFTKTRILQWFDKLGIKYYKPQGTSNMVDIEFLDLLIQGCVWILRMDDSQHWSCLF